MVRGLSLFSIIIIIIMAVFKKISAMLLSIKKETDVEEKGPVVKILNLYDINFFWWFCHWILKLVLLWNLKSNGAVARGNWDDAYNVEAIILLVWSFSLGVQIRILMVSEFHSLIDHCENLWGSLSFFLLLLTFCSQQRSWQIWLILLISEVRNGTVWPIIRKKC